MKSSNVLLGLWFLVVAALAFTGVWYFMRQGAPSDSPGARPVGTADPKGSDPKAPANPRSPRATATNRPKAEPAVLSGRVVDIDGKPVPDAAVRVLPPSKPAPPPSEPDFGQIRVVNAIVDVPVDEWDQPRPLAAWSDVPAAAPDDATIEHIVSGASGPDGKFSLTIPLALGRGPFRVTARKEGLGSAGVNGVVAGQDVELILATGGVVTGLVVSDARSGPVVGARLAFDSGERRWLATSDEQGAFRIEGMSPGRYELRAGAKSYTPILGQSVVVVRDQPVIVKLPRGVKLRVKALLDDGSTRRGDEAPVPKAEVVALNEDTYAYVVGTTDDYGVAEFEGLPAGRWIVNGRAPNVISYGEEAPVLVDTQEVHELELLFEPAVPTPITVVDESGQPVAGMEFYAANPDEEYDVVLSEKIDGVTDASGQIQFPFEFSGRRSTLFGFRKGFAVVRATPEDHTTGDPLRLTAKKAVRVHGKVTTPSGAAIPDAVVFLTIDVPIEGDDFGDEVMVRLRTGADGAYDFPFVPEGSEVLVEAETEDGISDDSPTVEPTPGKTDYEVHLVIDDGLEPEVGTDAPPRAPAPPQLPPR